MCAWQSSSGDSPALLPEFLWLTSNIATFPPPPRIQNGADGLLGWWLVDGPPYRRLMSAINRLAQIETLRKRQYISVSKNRKLSCPVGNVLHATPNWIGVLVH